RQPRRRGNSARRSIRKPSRLASPFIISAERSCSILDRRSAAQGLVWPPGPLSHAMPLPVLFPGPGDPRVVVAPLLLSAVLLVLQLSNAGAGLASGAMPIGARITGTAA